MAKKNEASVVLDAPLPSMSTLPEFEGVQPVGVVTKINGASQRITRAIHLGESGVALVEWRSEAINHKRTKDGLKRHQTLDVLEMWELPAEQSDLLLAQARRQKRIEDDERTGAQPIVGLEDAGDQVVTDNAGVVMTDGEVAEATGKPLIPDDSGDTPPWLGYEELKASEVIDRLKATDNRELVLAVGDFEESHRARKTVMDAAMHRSAELLAKEER